MPVMAFGVKMRRREFIGLLGVMASGAQRARAQTQQRARQLIGVLHGTTFGEDQRLALQDGLSEVGYAEGRDYTFLVRTAENKPNLLPALATDLIDAKVSVIV